MIIHKKILTLLLTIPVFISMISFGSLTANCIDDDLTSGDFEYTISIDSDGYEVATLEKYNGNASNLVLPSEIEGYIVRKVSGSFLGKLSPKVVNLTIPDSIKTILRWDSWLEEADPQENKIAHIKIGKNLIFIDGLLDLHNLVDIEVSPDNPYYCSVDGVLYSKDMKTLIQYPCKKNDYEFRIPDEVIVIDPNAFYGCENLTEVVIPDSVVTIDEEAFKCCSNLERVNLGKNVSRIGYYAFFDCKKLKSIKMHDMVSIIYGKSFGYIQDGNNEVRINDFKIEGYAGTVAEAYAKKHGFSFTGIAEDGSGTDNSASPISDFKYEIDSDSENYINDDDNHIEYIVTSITISGYIGNSPEVVIPKKVNHIPITDIGSNAFKSYHFLKKVVFHECVSGISLNAFEDCTSLEVADLPYALESLGMDAFYGCSSLKKIVIPDKVSGWASEFAYCSSLESVHLGKGFSNIEKTFQCCSSLKSITVDEGNPYLYSNGCNGVFYGGNGSVRVLAAGCNNTTILEGTNIIYFGAFIGMNDITSIDIPSSVSEIRALAFLKCDNMKSITIPQTVSFIGEKALGYTYTNSMDVTTKMDDFTIRGYAGTAAQNYAEKNGFTFVNLTDGTTINYEGTITDTEPLDPEDNEPTNPATEVPQPATSAPVDTQPAKLTSRFYVTGSKGLCGTEWANTADPNTLMTLKSDGSYEKVFKNVPAGNYSFKVIEVTDAGEIIWHPGGTDNDSKVTVANAESTVTVTLVPTRDSNLDTATAEVSEGQTLAVENSTSPVVVNPTDKIPGDVNGDGDVDMKDVTRLQKYINKWNVEIKEQNSDVNGDGDITMKDIILLQKYINKWDVVLK